MAASHRFSLKFSSNAGSVIRFSIPRADTSKSSADVRTSMEALISGGAIATANGNPEEVHGAALITTERETLF